MPTLDELLQQVLELDVFLMDCPKSCQQAAAFVEQTYFTYPTPDRFNETISILNCLSLARGIQRTMLNDSQLLNEQLQSDYLTAMGQKRQVMSQFIEDHPELFHGGGVDLTKLKDINLDKLINEQLDQLLYLYISQYTSGTLGRLITEENTTFLAKSELANALKDYQLRLIDIVLHQFNIIRLIELKSEYRQSVPVVKTIRKLIERKLIESAQPDKLSLSIIEKLQGELKDLVYGENINQPITPLTDSMNVAVTDLIEHSTESDEHTLSEALGFEARQSLTEGNPPMSSILHLFKSNHTTLEFCMSNVFQHVMKQRSTINEEMNRPEQLTTSAQQRTGIHEVKPLKFDNQKTKDKALQDLGKVVEKYSEMLHKIQEDENKSYPNRETQHIENRQKAVRTLLRSINRADELTAPLKYLGFMLIQEIKANKPTWKERSLIIKIVDILFLGIPALLRNTFFKRTLEAEKALLKTTESFPHDMKQVEAMRKQQSSPPNVGDTDSVDGESSPVPPSPNT